MSERPTDKRKELDLFNYLHHDSRELWYASFSATLCWKIYRNDSPAAFLALIYFPWEMFSKVSFYFGKFLKFSKKNIITALYRLKLENSFVEISSVNDYFRWSSCKMVCVPRKNGSRSNLYLAPAHSPTPYPPSHTHNNCLS